MDKQDAKHYENWIYVYDMTTGLPVLFLILPFDGYVSPDDTQLVPKIHQLVNFALKDYKAQGHDYGDKIFYRIGGVNQEFVYVPDIN